MAYYSFVLYTGNGITTDYSFTFQYIDKAHIKAKVDNKPVTFSWLGANTIKLTTPPAAGLTLEIYRETPQDVVPVNFKDGSVLLERDLNLLVVYNQFAAQEASDKANRTIAVTGAGYFDALNLRIGNMADPKNDQDAVTKKWAETAVSSGVAQAQAAANAAGASEYAAQQSAQAAGNFRAAAYASANDSINASTAADLSAKAAASSATSAANSKGVAEGAASSATQKALDAAASATAAATSAANASGSATAAATSATNAASSLDAFKKRYQGDLPTAPLKRYDGSALQAGDLYFNTTENLMKVYGATGWANATSAINVIRKVQTFIATANQTVFPITGGYDGGYADAYLNGIRLMAADVNVSSGANVVLTKGAKAGDELDVVCYGAATILNCVAKTGDTMSGDLVRDSAGGVFRGYYWKTDGKTRWSFGTSSDAEVAGSGSHLAFFRWNDAGNSIVNAPLWIGRNDGSVYAEGLLWARAGMRSIGRVVTEAQTDAYGQWGDIILRNTTGGLDFKVHLRANASDPTPGVRSLEILNSDYSAVNMAVKDNGEVVIPRGQLVVQGAVIQNGNPVHDMQRGIGSFVMAQLISGGVVDIGGTVNGNQLKAAAAGLLGPTVLSGTYRCCGYVGGANANFNAQCITLWQRIS